MKQIDCLLCWPSWNGSQRSGWAAPASSLSSCWDHQDSCCCSLRFRSKGSLGTRLSGWRCTGEGRIADISQSSWGRVNNGCKSDGQDQKESDDLSFTHFVSYFYLLARQLIFFELFWTSDFRGDILNGTWVFLQQLTGVKTAIAAVGVSSETNCLKANFSIWILSNSCPLFKNFCSGMTFPDDQPFSQSINICIFDFNLNKPLLFFYLDGLVKRQKNISRWTSSCSNSALSIQLSKKNDLFSSKPGKILWRGRTEPPFFWGFAI